MWATLTNRFVLVEWLIKRAKRNAFAFSNEKKEITVFEKWVEIRKELEDKDEIIALNKADLVEPKLLAKRKKALEKFSGKPVYLLSGATREGMDAVLDRLVEAVGRAKKTDGAQDKAWTPV